MLEWTTTRYRWNNRAKIAAGYLCDWPKDKHSIHLNFPHWTQQSFVWFLDLVRSFQLFWSLAKSTYHSQWSIMQRAACVPERVEVGKSQRELICTRAKGFNLSARRWFTVCCMTFTNSSPLFWRRANESSLAAIYSSAQKCTQRFSKTHTDGSGANSLLQINAQPPWTKWAVSWAPK
jgi:hypothetical protein